MAGTLAIVVDIRIGTIDILADAVGALFILWAVLRLDTAVAEARPRSSIARGLAVVCVAAGVIETVTVGHPIGVWLALSQVIGAFIVADLLADADWNGEDVARTAWRQTRHASLWLGAVPMIFYAVVGALTGPVEIQAPAAIIPTLVLAIPFALVVRALYLTMTVDVSVGRARTRRVIGG